MDNYKLISIAGILLLLLISCYNFTYNINENEGKPKDIDTKFINNPDALINIDFEGQTRGSNEELKVRGDIENKAHGGSWLDTFKDDSQIDWGLSDHLNMSNGEVKIKRPLRYKADSNTVAFWRFDEGSGNKAYDDTSNNNDGTLYGDTSWTTGRFGNAVYFDGSGNDVIDVPDSNSLDISNEFTIEGWVYRDEIQRKDMVLAKEHCYYIQIGSNDLLMLNIFTTSNNGFYSVSTIPAKCWVHFAATANGSTVNIYLNGSLDASYKQTVNCAIRTKKLEIGRLYYQPLQWFYKGKIDELRISNIARDPKPLANLTSKQINLPANKCWDTLIVNATQPRASKLNITILNASNSQPIPGSPKKINKDEYDISYIDPNKYPAIKLNASFVGNTWGLTPILHYWGVSWIKGNVWRDTFFGGAKVDSLKKVEVLDGRAYFQNTGSVQSNPIVIPDKCYYNSLIISKTEPVGTSLKVTIFDAYSDTLIPGYNGLMDEIIDISDIDPQIYPSIKLKANYFASGAEIGELNDWTINWTKNIVPKIQDITSLLSVNRTRSIKLTINLTDLEEIERELTLKIEYKSPIDTDWQTQYMSGPLYASNHWEAIFSPPSDADVGAYSFKFTCNDSFQCKYTYPEPYSIEVMNNEPIIWDVTTDSINNRLNRTKLMKIVINATDVEDLTNELGINIKYKSPIDAYWQTEFVSNIFFTGPHWVGEFAPKKNAHSGLYILNISCTDDISEVYEHVGIRVINNKPTLSVLIDPLEPRTMNDLNVTLIQADDIETDTADLEYWYYWSVDDNYRPDLDNLSKIPHFLTAKDETWYCMVYPFDGEDLGIPAAAEVKILNTPPKLMEDWKVIEMFEDQPIILEAELTAIFNDPDNETLLYLTSGGKNININITQRNGTIELTPRENWFGEERVTFYAYDSSPYFAEITILIIVEPTNDLPRITRVGDQVVNNDQELQFTVYQNEWLNLTVLVEDIDGDVERGKIKFKLSINEEDNCYFQDSENKIIFRPENEDVGWLYFILSSTDNNDTPPRYTNQIIRIEIRNVNDPPAVRITSPKNDKEFFESDKIDLICEVIDADLLMQDTNEMISYLWSVSKDNNTIFYKLGTEQQMINQTFNPGYYNITVKVTDTAGETAYDYVHFNVIEKPKVTSAKTQSMTNILMWSGLILIIIMILLILLLFIVNLRKKEKMAGISQPEVEVLQPSEAYRLRTEMSSIMGTARAAPQLSQTSAAQATSVSPAPTLVQLSSTSVSQQPIAQLPPASTAAPTATTIASTGETTQVQTETNIDQRQTGNDFDLSPELKLQLLEKRFLQGEIDQDIYLNLKAKFELAAKANTGENTK